MELSSFTNLCANYLKALAFRMRVKINAEPPFIQHCITYFYMYSEMNLCVFFLNASSQIDMHAMSCFPNQRLRWTKSFLFVN